jgi:hypothetical protein
MDVSLNDDQMRARTKAAAQNLAVLKHITFNLIRLDPIKRTGGSKPGDSSPPLPIPIALSYSDSDNVHAIAPEGQVVTRLLGPEGLLVGITYTPAMRK